MAVPMTPTSDQWGAYFPPGFEKLYAQMGLEKRWPNFTFRELMCKGTGSLRVHYETMDKIQRFRTMLGRPVPITSYYRSAEYNASAAVGGAEASLHLAGRAFDTTLLNGSWAGRAKLIHLGTVVGFRGFGLYPKFTHLDTGRTRFWQDDDMPELFGEEPIRRAEIYPVGKNRND